MITTAIGGATQTSAATREVTSGYGELGSPDQFMRLLLTQLRNQDPLNPMDQTEFLAELAQLQSVSELRVLREHLQLASATDLLGREVEFADPAGGSTGGQQSVTGTVQAVRTSTEGPLLVLDVPGRDYEVIVKAGDVQSVRAGP